MTSNDGMSYDELVRELKNMKQQIVNHKKLCKEMHRLDVEYWYIQHMEKKGLLTPIEIANANSSNS